jgi:hypothetical protein
LRIDDLYTHGLPARRFEITGARDHADVTFCQGVEHERRYRPAYIHLTRHGLGDGGSHVPGGDRASI